VNARDLGIRIGELEPGPNDAITDVAGVRVGHTTLIEGDNVRTGVTVILPTPDGEPCFAAAHRLNGNGELTGLEWIRESGLLTTPVGLTNTFSVGVVRDALVASQHAANRGRDSAEMLAIAAQKVAEAGFSIVNLDCVVHAERPKLADYQDAIRHRIAGILGLSPFQVGLKAKTGEGVGPVGREEIIEARCVTLLEGNA